VVMAMIYALGDISGAHMNPAVTIAFWRLGLFSSQHVAGYLTAQCSAAIAASSLLFLLFPDVATMGQTIPHMGIWRSFIMEIFLSFVLMFVIIHVSEGSKEKGLLAGVAIGAVVGLEALFAGPLTGASMNPARSLGPALYTEQLSVLWLYILGPVLGMLLASATCSLLRGKDCC
jgi:MIP family channel proteins